MASLTKFLKAQTIDCLGPAPSTKWLAFSWGVGTWGQKAAGPAGSPPLPLNIGKVWSKSNAITATQQSSVCSRQVRRTWSGTNQILFTHKNSDLEKTDGRGFHYLFIDQVTNAESAAASAVYTASLGNAAAYTSLTVTAVTWSLA